MNSTNYYDTFIEVAEDYLQEGPKIPEVKGGKKSVALMQYEMLIDSSYEYTSDDVLAAIDEQRMGRSREEFHEKGRPCFRASPLTKSHGWGVHSDSEGKIAIYPVGSSEYEQFTKDPTLKHLKAMRSKRV